MSEIIVAGLESPSDQSLVAVCDLRPITMGERIARYVRTPKLRDDLVQAAYHDDDYDPDEFYDDEDRPMSPHEERFAARKERLQREKTRQDLEARKLAEEKARIEAEEFAARVNAVKNSVPSTE